MEYIKSQLARYSVVSGYNTKAQQIDLNDKQSFFLVIEESSGSFTEREIQPTSLRARN